MLWDRITNGIMRAWSYEQNKDLADDGNLGKEPKFDGNIVSISEYVVGINWLTKTELFGGYCNESPTDRIPVALYNAILGNDNNSIRQLINHYKDLKLNIEHIKELYKQIMECPQNNGNTTVNILQHICPEASRSLAASAPTSRPDFNNAVQSIANKLLYGLSFSKLTIIKCCKSLRKRNLEELNDEELRWSVFTNNWENAGIFWSASANPILSALISSRYLHSMARKADELFKDSQSIYNHSRLFVKRAECLLDMLFKHNEDMATDALEHVSEVWGHAESALNFAQQFGMEEFISNSSIQKIANKKLFGYKSDKVVDKGYNSINAQEHTNSNEPTHAEPDNDLSSFITHHYKKKEAWKYLTAPLAKISIHFLVFLTSLIMFIIFLCTNLNVGVISELEIIVCVIMAGDFLEEICSMLRCYHECRWSPARIVLHLFDIWNFLDMLCFVLYFIGFGIHLTGSEELITHVRRIYSISLFIMFFRILNIFLMFKRIGIIVIMIKEMLIDLWRYLMILLVLIVAAGVVYHANMYPNHTLTIERIRTVLKIPYWQVYGELNLDTLEGSDQSCTNNATLWNADPTVESCPEGDWITSFIAAFYMMLTNWLLMNIVISMFSSRYHKVKGISEQKWLYHRHSVIINFEHWIPSPFNVILRPITMIYQSTLGTRSKTLKQGDVKTMLEKQKEFAKEIIDKEDKHNYN